MEAAEVQAEAEEAVSQGQAAAGAAAAGVFRAAVSAAAAAGVFHAVAHQVAEAEAVEVFQVLILAGAIRLPAVHRPQEDPALHSGHREEVLFLLGIAAEDHIAAIFIWDRVIMAIHTMIIKAVQRMF